jgi:outer membrane protein assembly factor BamD
MTAVSRKLWILIIFLSVGLTACGGNKDLDDLGETDEDAKELYQRARNSMNSAQFEFAIRYFQALEARYPFSPYALQAQLDLAYTYYNYGQAEKAIAEADRFIRFNPTHPNVDYAYYLKGLANFKRNRTFLERWFPRNPADHNQKPMQDAFSDFTTLITKFPKSQYSADARQHLIYLKNMLAEHEIHVAEYYLRRKAWVGAANRANYVLQYFFDTPHNQDALVVLVRAYRGLGLKDAEQDALTVLKLNFPDHPLVNGEG